MKIKAYIKMCMLLVPLSLLSVPLSSQVMETTVKEQADSAGHPPVGFGAAQLEHPIDGLGQPVQARACVTTFTNQTVSSTVSVTGCNVLTVQNVSVIGGGNLSMTAPAEVFINGAFDVYMGGQLNVSVSAPPPPPPPPGNTIQIAINIGTSSSPFQYSDTKNTAVDYTNDYAGRPTNDVFYMFTITTPMDVTIKHCGSSMDTYLHLLNASGTRIAYNDDYSGAGACGATSHAYLKQYLEAGTYYVVSEGYSANGLIQTAVTGEIPQWSFNYSYDASGNRTARELGAPRSSMISNNNSGSGLTPDEIEEEENNRLSEKERYNN